MRVKCRRGQTVTETIILAPLFFVLVFGCLQLAQLGVALIVANYGASSIARKVVQAGGSSGSDYTSKFNDLLSAGMKKPTVVISESPTGKLSDVSVDACAEIAAFPFVATLFGRPLGSVLGAGSVDQCASLRRFAFNNGNFVVHGEAKARMNYRG
jgi:hypothetical protein